MIKYLFEKKNDWPWCKKERYMSLTLLFSCRLAVVWPLAGYDRTKTNKVVPIFKFRL